MTAIFDLIAIPLGYVMHWIYTVLPNYFATLFVFTLLFKLLLFPLGLKSQKNQADRARLQPRLDRIAKKYGQDRQKLQQKQMELYEKENVSMTGGCAPMLIQMLLLFGVIAVIYKPLTFLQQMPADVIGACQTAVTAQDVPKKATDAEKAAIEAANKYKIKEAEMQGYYGEIRMLSVLDKNEAEAKKAIQKVLDKDKDDVLKLSADEYYDQMLKVRQDFLIGDLSLLDQPWVADKPLGGISWLWLIPLLSGLTALASTLLSSKFTKALTASPNGEKQPGQGCTNGMMYFMPLFSVYISFIVPCCVGIYWIFSNLLALVQTYVLNKIYDPVKIRAQAEAEYLERRRKKAAEKKRLAESRKREEELAAAEEAAALPEADKPKEKKLTAEQRNRLAEKEAAEAAQAEQATAEADETAAEDAPTE